MNTAHLIAQIAQDPKRMEILLKVLDDPKRGLEALNLMISRETDPEAIRRLQGLRDALESYVAETRRAEAVS